jgi:hypothetical protein
MASSSLTLRASPTGIAKSPTNHYGKLGRSFFFLGLGGIVVATHLFKSMSALFSPSLIKSSYTYDESLWYTSSLQRQDNDSQRRSSIAFSSSPDVSRDGIGADSPSTVLINSNLLGKSSVSSISDSISKAVSQSPEGGTKSNRTLVVVLGNVRGGEPAWRSMCQHLLDANNADLALLIGEGDPGTAQPKTLLHQRAKYIWTVPEFDDWADAMDDIPGKPVDWRERLFSMTDPSRVGNILLGAAHNISGSGALVFMFRYYLSIKIQEYDLLSRYERFVVTRSDHFYLCVHDLSKLSHEFLWVPTGSDYFGICDRHFVANNATILAALDVLPPLVRNPEMYKEQVTTYPYNTERFLLLRWQQEGLEPLIRRFDRNMFLVAGSSDDTRWKPKGRYIKELDVYLKYSQEYLQSRKSCRNRQVGKRR